MLRGRLDRRRVAGLEARPTDLLRSGAQRGLPAVPPSAAPGPGARRRGRVAVSPRSRPCSRRVVPTSTRRSPIRSSWSGPWPPPGPARATSGSCCRPRFATLELSERLRSAGVAAAARVRRLGAVPRGLRATAHGTWVFGEERYSRTLREREALPFDARGLREHGQAELDRLDAEMSHARGAHRRHARLARGHRALGPGSPLDRRGDAPGLRGLDRASARLPRARAAWSACPTARSARSSRRRCSSGRSSGSPHTWRRLRSATRSRATSSCPSRPTARLRRGDRQTVVEQQPSGASRPSRCTRHTRVTTGTW